MHRFRGVRANVLVSHGQVYKVNWAEKGQMIWGEERDMNDLSEGFCVLIRVNF